MMQVGTNQSTKYHNQSSISSSGGQAGRSSSTSRQQQQQQQQPQYDNDQLANIRPRLCTLRKWPHYDGYGVHLARNQHWLGLRVGDVEPNSPAESGGLLREDVILSVNGHSVENDDFFVILSFIQHELEDNQIRFLVLDPHSADLARRNHLTIDENFRSCVRMETPASTVSTEKLLFEQWRAANTIDPITTQNTIHLGPTNQNLTITNASRFQQVSSHEAHDDVYTFLPYSDTNNNLASGTRMSSLALRSGNDTIGISIQPDNDFGHIIASVEENSPAARAGIQGGDCVVSLNGRQLLNIPYEEVLNIIKQVREEPSVDFLVAKKTYLLKSRENNSSLANQQRDSLGRYTDTTTSTAAEVMASSNISERNNSSTIPPSQALEQLYDKYSKEQTSLNRPKETVSTTTTIIGNQPYDRYGQQLDNDRYSSKQQQGQILQGVGPATADRSSWGVSSGKSTDDFQTGVSGDSSIRSNSQGRQRDTDNTKGRGSSLEDSFKPLQVGITNPASSQQSGNVSPNMSNSNFADDGQRISGPISSSQHQDNSPKGSSGLDAAPTKNFDTTYSQSSKENQTIQNLHDAVPIAPVPTSSTSRDYEQEASDTTQSNQSDYRLGSTKAISLPSKPNKAKQSMNAYDDTDDDDLSDISERSREDDISDPALTKNSQSNIVEYTDDNRDKTYSDKSQDEKRGFTSTNSATDQQIGTSIFGNKVIKARRLEQSDSDDAESQRAKQSAADSFYSPDESLEKQNETDEDGEEEEDEEHSNETSSNEGQRTPVPMGKMAFATMPLSELHIYGYELHDIQLMQPTETSPVGLKLTKQQDPLQYIITAVAKGTKADFAGLKVNDWLIKIEDNDIRLVEFAEVSQDIRHLLTDAGLINMVVARKKSSSSSRAKEITPTSSRSSSINQQTGVGQTSILTTDITRDTPDNSQVRFIPDRSTSPPVTRSERSQISTRETTTNATSPPLSVGLTNPISDENQTKTPREQSRSPTREYIINTQQKSLTPEQTSEEFDQNDIRHVVLKEALGLDFNSFIPEGDSLIQTHFISNVQPSSMADKAGLRDGDRILAVNGVDVTNSVHEDVRRMMQSKKPLQLSVVNDPKYLKLIENVKRNQKNIESTRNKAESSPPAYVTLEGQESRDRDDSENRGLSSKKSPSTDSINKKTILPSKYDGSPETARGDLSKYLTTLFNDDEGSVQAKHCILKKDPGYNGYGLLLRYQNGLHLIDQVEEYSPAYNAGLREDDVILFVDRKNVEQMTHDDVKIVIKKLSVSNTDIDLILIKKTDIQRYKVYQEKNTIDWKPILQNKLNNETNKTEQQETSVTRPSNDQTTTIPRQSSTASSSSSKQQTVVQPPPPAQSKLPPGTRVCILQPSAARTAGFALSGKSPPPYVICQIEKNSPAEKAGLLLNDVLLSINGISVTETSYEDTVKLVKEALQQKSVELVVQDQAQSGDRSKVNSQSSTSDQTKLSMGSNDSSTLGNIGGGAEPSRQGSNAVEEYQKQRNKELSYTLRLCHLHPTNGDGIHAATFGFELSEDPGYEYPLILRVEPQSPAEGAGLQSRDILLKINDRKTKGLGYDKVKKEIEKAKRDGRLAMLVVDQETYDYCKRTQKPLKEPDMKVKHIFPKSRSAASVHKLPVAAASSISSRDSVEQLNSSITKHDDSIPNYQRTSVPYRLSTPKETDSENEEDNQQNLSEKKISPNVSTRQAQPAVNFDLNTPTTAPSNASAYTRESPLKFLDRAQITSQQTGTSSTGRENVPSTARSTPALNQTSNKESKSSKRKAIPNAINNLFHRIGHPKSSKLDYETPPKTTVSTKARAPSPPTVRVGHNRLDIPRISQSLDTVGSNTTTAPVSSIHDTVNSTISTGSFDYLRGPRRCVLKVDRNKGLGFVLSATGDYDHTITAVEKYSAADIAGLQIDDEVLEVDGVDVRSVKYEQVVEMLVSAMRTSESIEMRVIDGHSRAAYPSRIDADKQANSNSLLNSNNNNNNIITPTNIHSKLPITLSGDDLSDINSSISPFDSLNLQKIATSYPNLPGQFKQFDSVTNRGLSGSVPALATGITASPSGLHHTKSISASSEKGSITKLSDISTHDAPVARLCRVRKFATSPFYGFFLCGDPKKLGRVFISDVTKHSPAAVCGLRDGDRILEINGTNINSLTYEIILDKIKQHMANDDLELLVLDKKSVRWYRERNYPITSRTLPTIVHIEPIINDGTSETQSSEIPATHTKMVGFADRRVSKTGL